MYLQTSACAKIFKSEQRRSRAWHPCGHFANAGVHARSRAERLDQTVPIVHLRKKYQQNTDHTHNTRTTTQPNTRMKHTTEPLSSDRRLRDDGACHLPRLGGWPRRSQHGKQGRSPTRPGKHRRGIYMYFYIGVNQHFDICV